MSQKWTELRRVLLAGIQRVGWQHAETSEPDTMLHELLTASLALRMKEDVASIASPPTPATVNATEAIALPAALVSLLQPALHQRQHFRVTYACERLVARGRVLPPHLLPLLLHCYTTVSGTLSLPLVVIEAGASGLHGLLKVLHPYHVASLPPQQWQRATTQTERLQLLTRWLQTDATAALHHYESYAQAAPIAEVLDTLPALKVVLPLALPVLERISERSPTLLTRKAVAPLLAAHPQTPLHQYLVASAPTALHYRPASLLRKSQCQWVTPPVWSQAEQYGWQSANNTKRSTPQQSFAWTEWLVALTPPTNWLPTASERPETIHALLQATLSIDEAPALYRGWAAATLLHQHSTWALCLCTEALLQGTGVLKWLHEYWNDLVYLSTTCSAATIEWNKCLTQLGTTAITELLPILPTLMKQLPNVATTILAEDPPTLSSEPSANWSLTFVAAIPPSLYHMARAWLQTAIEKSPHSTLWLKALAQLDWQHAFEQTLL